MSYAFILPDACRAAEMALAQLTVNMIAKRDTREGGSACKLSTEDLDLLRGRINTVRLKLRDNAYLKELWPAPHIAIGVKNNLPLVYAVHVVEQVATCLESLMADLVPEADERIPLAKIAGELRSIHAVLEDALAQHLRRKRVPIVLGAPVAEAGAITVQEVIELYVAYQARRVERGELTPDCYANRRHDLLRFCEKFGTQKVADTKQHDLSAWLEMNPNWIAVHTIKRVVNDLVTCFRWATEEEYIPKAPFHTPRAHKGKRPATRRPAERREYVALMKHGSRPLKLALFFLRRTGARTSEMRAVRWENLQLDVSTPHVRLDEHKSARQTGLARIIPLDQSTVRVLKALQRRAQRQGALSGKEFVFTNTDGGMWDRHTFARHLRRTAKRIGIDAGIVQRVTAYCLRHLFAKEAIEAGIGIRQVADVLGHQKTDMVSSVYAAQTRQNPEHLESVVDDIRRARRAKKMKKASDEKAKGKENLPDPNSEAAGDDPAKGAST